MNKILSATLVAAAATLALSSCQKEIEAPVATKGTPFEIVASTQATRTLIGEDFQTEWSTGDQMIVFHAEAGSTAYVSDNAFTIEDALAGIAKGELAEVLEDGASYDWYALYPYDSHIQTPANTSTGYIPVGSKAGESQVQIGNNSYAHISGTAVPMYGQLKAVASDVTPHFSMKQVASLVEVKVTNKNEAPIIVSSIDFVAPENIVGTYYIDFAGEAPSFIGSGDKYVSNAAKLEVEEGEEIEPGQSACFYLAVKPFTAAAGKEIKVTVNATDGQLAASYTRTIALREDVAFAAGHIKTVNAEFSAAMLASCTWDLSIDETATATDTELTWLSENAFMRISKGTATVPATNYYPGTEGKTYTSTRFYSGSVLTVMPAVGSEITSVVFEATTTGYASALATSRWTNASASVSGTTVTVTPTAGTEDIEAAIGGTCGFTAVTVYYKEAGEEPDDDDNYTYNIYLDFNVGGSINCPDTAYPGETVTVIAYPNDGYEVAEMTAHVDGEVLEDGTLTFTMPEGDVTVVVKFAEIEEGGEEGGEEEPGEGTTYTLIITSDDIAAVGTGTSGYTKYNGTQTWTATAENGTTFTVEATTNQIMPNNGKIQGKKNEGYIESITDLGNIESIMMYNDTADNSFAYSYGGGYFRISAGTSASYATSIVITFTK